MAKLNDVSKALDLFIQSGELRQKDAQHLYQIIKELDSEATIAKKRVIDLIASQSKDSEGNYRNFISRLKKGLEEAIEFCKDDLTLKILTSITIENRKSSHNREAALVFDAVIPKVLSDMVRPNQNYQLENFIATKGTSSTILKLFISYASKDAFYANVFKKHLEELIQQDQNFVQWSMSDLELGIDFDKEIKKELKACNYGIALLSEDFLQSEYIMDIELESFLKHQKLIPVGLKGDKTSLDKVSEHHNAQELFRSQIFPKKDRDDLEYFEKMVTTEGQKRFVEQLLESIKSRYKADQQNPPKNDDCTVLPTIREEFYQESMFINHKAKRHLIESRLEQFGRLESESYAEKPSGNEIDIQSDLLEWAYETKKPTPLYAMLGDYGMGKTFNCRIFAKTLYQNHLRDNSKATAVYIDLRDISTFVVDNGKTRQPFVSEIIDEVLRLSGSSYTAEEIIEKNKQGEVIIIFDGLDEKLVNYTRDMQSKFLRELLSILTIKEGSRQKILLSCRSHYFEDISSQDSFFMEYGRSGLGKKNYHSITILPLSMEHIEHLVMKLLSPSEANRLLSLINSETYLKSIATRPFMLNKIALALPSILQAKKAHRPLNTKTFYHALIEDTLKRDDEKHTIKVRHKKELLKALAYLFYTQGVQKIKIDELNDWFNEFILDNRTFGIYLRDNESLDILERDLRNSTLLVRFGEQDFGFSHSSIYEYFLSEYILSHWYDLEEIKTLSALTEQFILDGIALLSSQEQQKLFNAIEQTLQKPFSLHTHLALKIAAKLPYSIERIRLERADLREFVFHDMEIGSLEIIDSNLYGATFKQMRIQQLQLTNSNLNDTLFMQSRVDHIEAEGSYLNAITNDQSRLSWQQEPHHYHHLNHQKSLSHFEKIVFGHSNYVSSVAISEDGKHIVSGSGDGGVRIFSLPHKALHRLLAATNKEWYSIDMQSYHAKGTPKSWKLSTLFDDTGKSWRMDDLERFEVM